MIAGQMVVAIFAEARRLPVHDTMWAITLPD